ncbi:hypothetical protein HID58_087158 [Brassica napus]|uniref:Reverse transcriptase zinc-binding domain-containing protein n=1 Tax=Brassica napus TaxID=3708 RepID=A0ABQ7XUC0_BRANA|nr:hypothetical protein HID58_087158 [Brassica napus]
MLPQARSDAMVLVQTFLTYITLEDEVADAYEWNVTGAPTMRYKTSLVYWKLKGEEQRVPWAKIVWTSRGIPKHNFLVWLFMLNRCPTRDRLLSWGLSVDANCLLWNREAESRDHLFFRCPFSWRIWSEIARRCSFTPSPIWLDVMDQLITLTAASLPALSICGFHHFLLESASQGSITELQTFLSCVLLLPHAAVALNGVNENSFIS